MAIHWKIPFKSLRDKTDYCVNIYDDTYSGTAVVLKGGDQPFTTREDDNDDLFAPIRTQSGYIRIVDDGFAADGVTAFDWRDIIPQTDTDRPVTLTAGNTIVWQGYMQAQNFGSKIYGNPQEREYPVHCALSVMSREDVDISAYSTLPNFAGLLDYVLSTIPSITIDSIVVQGGADARTWLMKKFDWSVFEHEGDDGVYRSDCDVQTALQDMCMYWGWCARISGTTLFLLSPDDSVLVNFLVLTRAQLTTLAGGTTAGTVNTGGYDTQTIGNIFASTDNTDMQLRGYNKASLTSEVGDIDDNFIYLYPDAVLQYFDGLGYTQDSISGRVYTPNKVSFTSQKFSGEMLASSAGSSFFCIRKIDDRYIPVIKNALHYTGEGAFCIITTEKAYILADGEFEIRYKNPENENRTFYFSLSVSPDKEFDVASNVCYWNGSGWTNTQSVFNLLIDGGAIPTANIPVKYGYVKLALYGWFGSTNQDMSDLSLVFRRSVIRGRLFHTDRKDSRTYTARNNSMVKEDWSGSCMFTTDNNSNYGPGLVVNADGTYFGGWDYSQHQAGSTKPEQHMVDRVAAYWSTSKRMITCDVRADLLTMEPKPNQKITIDSTVCYPLSIGRDWRNDVITLKLIEI